MSTRSGKQVHERSRPRGIRLPTEFAWVMNLSATDRNTFISELLEALARNGSKQNASALIEDWRATAEAVSDRAIMKALRKAGKTTYTNWKVAFGNISRRSVQ